MTSISARRNRLQCLVCNQVIESTSLHDLVNCSCNSCFVDGGTSYQRIGGDMEKIYLLPFQDDERNQIETSLMRNNVQTVLEQGLDVTAFEDFELAPLHEIE